MISNFLKNMSTLVQSKEITNSPLIDSNDKIEDSTTNYTKNIYTYILSFIVVGLVIYLAYYSYTCFYDNQYIIDTITEKSSKTIDEDDFDVDEEVSKLIKLQDKNVDKGVR